MPARPTVHPSADVLKAFGLGKLDDTSADVLMNHLDQCADCCQVVASQSGDDFLDRLRQGHGRNTTIPPANALSESVAEPKPPRPPPSNQTAIPNLPPELANNPQYDILRELGRGGMGVVYLAKNKLMDRLEVLKVVNKTLLDRPGAVERFLREIRSAAKLSHANVVGAYSAVQVGDLLAFAMEYVEGEDLTAVVKTQGPLPVAHACYYVQQAALGLQHAFEKNMVHRDIKPQNLILAREGKKHIVKVLDFGLAKVMREKAEDSGLTGDGKMLGTPDYIAPEQTLDAASADIRADIYSLGCTLYYLLAGHPPFSAASLGAILLAHQMQEAKLLNVVRSEVPEELAAVVRKMMAKERAKRYQTPLEVAQALAVFVKPGVKGGTTPKSSPDLSLGTPKMAGVKAAKADGPAAPPAASAKPTTPEREATGDDAWSTSVMERGIASRPPRRSGTVRKSRPPAAPPAARKKWWIGGGVAAGVLLLALLGMWAGGVFKVKTKDGTLVLENLPANAEVVVDGDTVTVSSSDGKPVEIRVAAGKEHRLEVKKDGFKMFGEKIEIDTGGRKSVLVRLEPDKPTGEAALPSTFKNNLGMEFVLVPKGKSWLGGGYSKFGDKEVEIARDFYLGKYAVTQEEWEKVMDKNPSHFSRGGGGKDRVKDIADDELKRFPVEMVSWADCQVFVRQLNERVKEDGWVYRLPTEVEWEYACRGGPMADRRDSAFDFYFDKPANQLSPDQANFAPKAGTGLQRTCKVGTYKPNRLGLYDMHGNLWQWCAWEPPAEPKDAKASLLRVVRGGSCVAGWDGTACCRAAFRLPPVSLSHRDRDVGLRLARVPVGQESKQNTPAPRNGAPPRDVISPPADPAKTADYDAIATGRWVRILTAPGESVVSRGAVFKDSVVEVRDGKAVDRAVQAKDMIVRAKVKKLSGRDVALLVRQNASDPLDGNRYAAWFIGNDRFGVGKVDNKVYTNLQREQAVPEHAKIKDGEFFEFALAVVGDTLTVYINGKRVLERRDTTALPGTGAPGVATDWCVGLFKDIEVQIIDPAAKPAPAAGTGFRPLFNGKDLTGWKTHPKQPGNWRVLKGTGGGVLSGSGPAASYLYTERGDYKDFHLRVEARINDGGNSGVYCRTAFGPQIPADNPRFPLGYESQINSTHRDVNKTGSLYVGGEGAVVSIREAPVPPEKWFTMEAIVAGKHILVKVNGKTTADYTDDKQRFTSGHIALQQHDPQTVVEFRKIEIKELSPPKSESPATVNAEPAKSPPRGGESALPPEAKTAAKAFEKASADAREKLLAEFDTALERLAKIKGSTEQRLTLIDVVKAEKRRFENRGVIPWSEPMRPFVAKYFASTSDAESKVRRAYNALIDAQLRAKNENMVADLRADLGNLLSVRVLARWRHFGDGKPQGNHSLYSNGRIDNINGKATWIYAKGVLIYRWPAANAPGGAWIDTLNVSTDGTAYVGTNNFPPGRRPKITGVYLKDD